MRRALALCVCVASLRVNAADAPARQLVKEAVDALDSWDIEGADEIGKRLEQDFPGEGTARYVRGRVLFEQGDYARAAELLDSVSAEEDARLAREAKKATEKDHAFESEHFVLRAAGKDELLAPYALDTLEKQYAALQEDLRYSPPPGKIRVEIYPSPKVLAQVSSLTEGEIKASGTIALCKYNRLMVTSPRALVRGYDWLDTMAHELTHFVISKKSRNAVPIWIQEGLAKHLETRWRGGGGLSMGPAMEQLLAEGVQDDKLVPFEKMHPSIAKLPTQEMAALAFAEVETAMEYLRKQGGPGALERLVVALRDGKSDQAAVAESAHQSWDAFMKGWRGFIAHRPAVSGLSYESANINLKFAEEKTARSKGDAPYPEYGDVKDATARRYAHLGELMLERSRYVAAAVEYGRAHERVGDRSTTLSRRYGFTLLKLGKDADAERVLAGSVTLYPGEAPAHVLLAQLYQTRKAWDSCAEHAEDANRVDPFDPEVHALWAACAASAGGAANDAIVKRERAATATLMSSDHPSAIQLIKGGAGTSKETQ